MLTVALVLAEVVAITVVELLAVGVVLTEVVLLTSAAVFLKKKKTEVVPRAPVVEVHDLNHDVHGSTPFVPSHTPSLSLSTPTDKKRQKNEVFRKTQVELFVAAPGYVAGRT